MRKKILLAVLCLCAMVPLFAQNSISGKLSVRVLDAAGKPLPYAGVAIRKTADSALLKGQMSDVDGRCYFDQVTGGAYFVQVTLMGYNTHNTPAFTIDAASKTIDLKDVSLSPSSKNLKEVNITGQKPFVERTEGKTVLNVESSVAAAGNTVMDLLRRAPGVSVDASDNLTVRGKSGVTVMLDGKLTYLSNEALAELLKSMPAETVSQIEIITSPGAKYDAAGNTGIINIKTKKGQLTGLNGTLNANVGFGRYWFYGMGGSLNWRTKKFNAFGTLNYGDRQSYNTRELWRHTAGTNPTDFYQQVYQTNDFMNRSYKAGFDYFINSRQTIGILANGYFNAFWRSAPSSNEVSSQGKIDSVLYTGIKINNRFENQSYNINYKLKIDTTGSEFSVDADYAKFGNHVDNRLRDSMVNVKSGIITQSSGVSTRPYTYIDIYSVKADLVLTLNKTSKIEAGVKGSFVSTTNNNRYDSLLNGVYVPVLSQYDEFIYKENVYAAYFTYKKQFTKTDFTLGLRLEKTESDANSISLNSRIKRDYLDYFPNFTADHKFTENHKLSLAYSKRINRPGYGMLNPFQYFLDKYTYFRGNSFLTPEYTHNTELSYVFKTKYIASLAYSHTSDLFDEWLIQNDETKVTISTNRNLGTQNTYALNLTLPFEPTKWWKINLNVSGYYNEYHIRDTASSFNTSQWAYNYNFDNTLTLPYDMKMELGTWLESPNVYGIFKSKTMWGAWGGIQKEIMKKKATLKLNVYDIFASNRFRGVASYQNVYLNVNNRWQNRTMNLSFTYRFGNTKVEGARERKTGSEDEANRAG